MNDHRAQLETLARNLTAAGHPTTASDLERLVENMNRPPLPPAEQLREALEKLTAPKPRAEPPGTPRRPNRHERRRAASRRWRG